jgi:hypothetical protein
VVAFVIVVGPIWAGSAFRITSHNPLRIRVLSGDGASMTAEDSPAGGGGPTLSIQRSGLISLNRIAYRAFGSPVAVELLYDRAARVVALRPVDPRARHSYPVRPANRRGGGTYLVSAVAFTRFYGIDISTCRRWRATVCDGVLSADLSTPGTPSSSTSAATGSLSDVHG